MTEHSTISPERSPWAPPTAEEQQRRLETLVESQRIDPNETDVDKMKIMVNLPKPRETYVVERGSERRLEPGWIDTGRKDERGWHLMEYPEPVIGEDGKEQYFTKYVPPESLTPESQGQRRERYEAAQREQEQAAREAFEHDARKAVEEVYGDIDENARIFKPGELRAMINDAESVD